MGTGAPARSRIRGAGALALVSTLLLTHDIHALDFGNTLTFGELHERGEATKLFSTEALTSTLDISDALSWNLDLSATHYLSSATSSAFSMLRLGTGFSWDPDDHISIDIDGAWLPRTGYTFDDGDGLQSYRTSSLGLSLDASYDIDPENKIIDHELLLSFAATRYASTESAGADPATAASSASVFQARFAAGTALTVRKDTRLELNATYYAYAGSSYSSGAPVPNPLGFNLGAAVPVEPLRFALRADLTRKLGDLRLGAYVQGGSYVNDGGESLLAGARVTWVISSTARVSLSGYLQRMLFAGFDPLSIAALSVGLRVYF